MFGKLFSMVIQALPRATLSGTEMCTKFNPSQTTSTEWSLNFVRTRMRYHFPHPSERRRVLRHGWAARMATPAGRRILMRRILKGRFVLSH